MLNIVFVCGSLLFLLLSWLAPVVGLDATARSFALILSYFFGGWYGMISALKSLRKREMDIDLLMILAALGAAWIGSPAEGALLLFLFSLSNVLQEYAMGRTHKAIEGLAKLRPATARKWNGEEGITTPIEEMSVEDQLMLMPGDLVPLDGEVLSGESSLDESSVTGESMPVQKQEGSTVFAGSLNQNGSLIIRVTRTAEDSTLARLIALVEKAREQKAKSQRVMEDFEKHYAAGVVLFTLLLIAVVPHIYGVSFREGMYRAITVMVVASPCALIISTPASILSAIARGARSGILFKGGVQLERGARIRSIAFDKTGTLTLGKASLHGVIPLTGDYSEDQILSHAASVESRSEHPLAKAIVLAARSRKLAFDTITDFQSTPGKGVTAQSTEQKISVGRIAWLKHEGVEISPENWQKIEGLEDNGFTVVGVACGCDSPQLCGLITLSDQVRPDARDTISRLRKQGISSIAMLTGDNERVARRIAESVGIDTWYASLLPEDKVSLIDKLRSKGEIAMVGDGTNDAPALAHATVGIAMGAAGSDVALESADIVLMASDLDKLPLALRICRAATSIIHQNLAFALSVIVIMVILTLALPFWGIEVPLPIGVLAHEGGTVLVCLNGLRLLTGWHR